MRRTDEALWTLERIQNLWKELGQIEQSSPECEKLMGQIRVLSEEYEHLIDAAEKPDTRK